MTSWPLPAMTAQAVIDTLLEYWRTRGLPAFVPFENDICFQGPHQHPGTVGHVIQLDLALHVVPVFVLPHETGFQAAIERFNAQ